MKKKEIEIGEEILKRENGLQDLVSLACSFKSDIKLVEDGKTINAKSIIGIMAFSASAGKRVTIEVEGADQDAALSAMVKFLKKKWLV